MNFSIILIQRAQDELDELPDKIIHQINEDIQRLKDNPIPDGKRIKKLQGYKNLYRLRAGDYRIVFERDGMLLRIRRVLNRKDFDKYF